MKKLFVFFLLSATVFLLCVNAFAASYGLSPAIGVLKADTVMQKSGVSNTDVKFSIEDFEKTTGKSIS